MNLPTKVNICGINYTITYVDKPSEVDIIVPYGKWWQHLLRGRLYMAYRAVFGWKRKGAYRSPLILDNWGIKSDGKQTELP